MFLSIYKRNPYIFTVPPPLKLEYKEGFVFPLLSQEGKYLFSCKGSSHSGKEEKQGISLTPAC